MKYFSLLLIALAFAACNRASTDIEFNGTATGFTSGTVIIKDQTTNDALFKADIENGKFHINKQILTQKGYADLTILEGGSKPLKFEIYMEPGTYDIKIDKDHINDYPVITSAGPTTQAQFTNYYVLADGMTSDLRKKVKELNAEISKPGADADVGSYSDLSKDINRSKQEIDARNLKALAVYINKYPENTIAAHIMARLNYTDDPKLSNDIYKRFSPEAKKTDEGMVIGDKLSSLLNLSKGSEAPAIEGTTPDGKTVDLKAQGVDLILVEFWRSDSELSTKQHETLGQMPGVREGKLKIISISLDTNRELWLKAIKTGNLTWTQVSDLKGNSSPNASKWGIASLPAFYLLNGSGEFIQRDVQYNNLATSISSYLTPH